MTLDQIALGHTYRLVDAGLGFPTVVVEAITVDDTCTPGYYTPVHLGQHALVWVYEAARDARYPTDPAHLNPRVPQSQGRHTHTPSEQRQRGRTRSWHRKQD